MDIQFLLSQMGEKKASDLHIVAGVAPVYRIDGKLQSAKNDDILTGKETRNLVYSLMTAEQREEFEKTRELDFSYGVDGVGRFRVNAHYQRSSVAASIRMIPNKVPSLAQLNLPSILTQLALKNDGLLLVTGPTGCGKSTTLASLVDIINRKKSVHIIIIEDPIEYLHSHQKSVVEQREVGGDTLSFAASLKYALRQDPDVILIAEMRDLETISTAITAAETGHLVMATLHTPDAAGAIDRITDVFPSYQQSQVRMQLASSLIGVVTQALLPREDKHGRVPAVEILISTPAVANLIRTGKTHQIFTSMQTGSQYGMQTMDQALENLVKRRLISMETALQRAKDPNKFRSLL